MTSTASRRARTAQPLGCARRVIAVVPPLMREIRSEMRRAAPAALTVPQFRILIFARHHPGASISDVAAHLGVTLPTASVAVDRLVRQALLQAPQTPDNRRRRSLDLTPEGARIVADAMNATTAAFARRLAALDAADRALVEQALAVLERHVLQPAGESEPS